jgi:membrane fusion protein, multidrug efflux system
VSDSIRRPMVLRGTVAVILPFLFVACSGKSDAPPAAPPTEVGVVTLEAKSVPAVFEFVGQAKPSKSVEVRSLVTGTIVERYFREGTDVKVGQPLYLIDPEPYQATYQSTDASVESAVAVYEQAKRDYARSEALFKGGAISQRDFDVALTNVEKAKGSLAERKASMVRANVDLKRTRLVAEAAGRIGETNLEVGAQVAGASELLTTIDKLDPIFVDLSVSDNDRLRYEENVRAKAVTPPAGGQYKVQLVLSDSSLFPTDGRINFGDQRLDPGTGSLRLRAEFRNPELRLLPGQFVRARLTGATRHNAVLVPQVAVQQALGRQFVYVVAAGDTAKTRDVTTGTWAGSDWIIEKGLEPGDRVIVDNLQRVRPGLPVRPKPWQPATAPVATAAGAAR